MAENDVSAPTMIVAGGRRLEYRLIEGETGPTLVFLHEGLGSMELERFEGLRDDAGVRGGDAAGEERPTSASAWLVTTGIRTRRSSPGTTSGSAPGFRDWNIEGYISGIDCPTLLIQGREDAAVAGES